MPIYLDELGPIEQLPLGIALLVLTILEGDEAVAQAKQITDRAQRSADGDGIIEMIATILVICGLNKPGIQNLFVRFGARRAMPLHIRVSENVGVWLAEP